MFAFRDFARAIGKTQTELADILGTDQSQISKMINGRRDVREEHITILRNAFGGIVDKYVIADDTPIQAATMQPYPAEEVRSEQPKQVQMPVLVPQSVVRKPDVDVMEWVDDLQDDRARHAFNIMKILSGAKVVVQMNNNAMMGALNLNEYAFLRPFSEGVDIIDGEIYGVETRRHGILVRFLYNDGDTILTRPKNTLEYGDIRLEKDEIKRFYHIVFHGSTVLTTFPDPVAGSREQLHMQNEQINQLISQLDKSGDRVDRLIDLVSKK